DHLVVRRAEDLLLDPPFALLMYEVKRNGLGRGRRVEFYRDRHQTEGNRPCSDSASCHARIVAQEFSNCRKVRQSFLHTKLKEIGLAPMNPSALNPRIAVGQRSAERSSFIFTMLGGVIGICGSSSAACFGASRCRGDRASIRSTSGWRSKPR